MIISRTPLRVSFAGGGTDLRAFYRNEKYGAVVSTAIKQYVYIVIHPYFHEKIRIKYSRTEDVTNISEIHHPIVRECLKKVAIGTGIEIASFADVPAGSGLGSSSAFTVGLLHALYAFKGILVTKHQLAAEASEIEIDLLGEPIGKQDQYASAFGGLNFMRFQADETVVIEPIVLDDKKIKHLENTLLLYYVGGSRQARQILSEVEDSLTSGTINKVLRRIRDQTHKVRKLLENNDYLELGSSLREGWQLKRKMASEVSNKRIDSVMNSADNLGSTGGKLLGAGSDGFLLLSHRNHDALSKGLGLRTLPLQFEKEGSKIIFTD